MTNVKAITIEDNEEYLRQTSKEVDLNDENLQNDIEILETFCKENEVMAMAAIQLGIPKRLIYLKNTNLEIINKQNNHIATEEEEKYNEARILINPVILNREGLTEYWEACASCLDNMGKVKRPYKISVKYYDIEGNVHQDVFEGFESTVLSHEMDHLDGILHIDIAEELILMPKEERAIFRNDHDYEILSKTGNFEDLLNNSKSKIKNKE